MEKDWRLVPVMDTNYFRKLCWKVARILRLVPRNELQRACQDILRADRHFLLGVQSGEGDLSALLYELSAHNGALGLSAKRCEQLLAANLRQTLLMSLIPANAFDVSYTGSIDDAVLEHLTELGVSLTANECLQIRNICVNIRRLRHLRGNAARRASASLRDLRADPVLYSKIITDQNQRCVWCGVDLSSSGVKSTLEHMAPKHIGDDPIDGSNWAIACETCNSGKEDLLSWASSPFANGYLRAQHFMDPKAICRENRWIVLARERQCDSCHLGPANIELGVYRQVTSGLAIPIHCSVTCAPCAATRSKDVLKTEWTALESTRTFG